MARDLVVGLYQYRDISAALLEQYFTVYRELGYRTRLFTLVEPGEIDAFRALIGSDEIAFIISITGQFARSGLAGSDPEPIWDKLKIPFLAYYPDGDFLHRADTTPIRSDYVRKCYPFEDVLRLRQPFETDEVYSFRVNPAVSANPFDTGTPWRDRPLLGVFVKDPDPPTPTLAEIEQVPRPLNDRFRDCTAI